MTIQEATRRFESWLGKQTHLDRSHLALKHKLMSKGAFPFLRATFYRWIQFLPAVCPELSTNMKTSHTNNSSKSKEKNLCQ